MGYYWQLFPNPASNFVEIKYNLPEGVEGKVEVFSTFGSKTDEIILAGIESKKILNTKNYSNGVYYCSFTVNGEMIETKRIVIVK